MTSTINQALSTKEFRMSPGKFVLEMIFRYGASWLLALCAIGVTGIALGILVDARWFFSVLLVIFVVAPMLLSLLYYYFGLRREAYVNTVRHTITLRENGLLFTLKFVILNKDKQEDVETEDEDTIEREEFFRYDDMESMKTGLNSVKIDLRSPAKGFIWIPRQAFSSDDEMVFFLKHLDSHINM